MTESSGDHFFLSEKIITGRQSVGILLRLCIRPDCHYSHHIQDKRIIYINTHNAYNTDNIYNTINIHRTVNPEIRIQ